MKVAIIGSGVYGKAIANVLVHNNCEVVMWTEKTDNSVIGPEGVTITNSYEKVLKGANLVYVLTGSKFTESVFLGMKNYLTEEMLVILGSKGILDSGELIIDVFEKIIKSARMAVISGPTFAVDVAALEPVGFTLATKDYDDYLKVKTAMSSVHLEYSDDIIGTEMAGSLKNAYAIGSGILGGFDYGNSVRCLYITRVLNEIKSIFKSVNAKEETVLTLAGIGDLVLTCTSLNSRNFTFGSILSLNKEGAKEEYLKNNTVEGYENLHIYKKVLQEKNIDAPILMCVADIVDGIKTSEALIDIILKD